MNSRKILPLICGAIVALAGAGFAMAESTSDARTSGQELCRPSRGGDRDGDRKAGRDGDKEGARRSRFQGRSQARSQQGSQKGGPGNFRGPGKGAPSKGGSGDFADRLLHRFDKDGDSKLSKEELRAAFQNRGPGKGGPGQFRGRPTQGGPSKGGPGNFRGPRKDQDDDKSENSDRPRRRGPRGPQRR